MSPTLLSLWKGAVPREVQPRSMREILLDVAALSGVSVQDLKSQKRCRDVVIPRQQAMAEMYATGRCSMPMIGSFLGGRDHTTILHGIRAHRKRALEQKTPADFPAGAPGPLMGEAQEKCA